MFVRGAAFRPNSMQVDQQHFHVYSVPHCTVLVGTTYRDCGSIYALLFGAAGGYGEGPACGSHLDEGRPTSELWEST